MVELSIIVAIYNQEQFLAHCLESAAAQDLTDYEVILINDGSTDMSGAICEKFAEKNKNFRYFHQENAGLGAARNLGLSHAGGRYIAFLDADDAYEKNSLGTAVAYMAENRLDILYVDEIICDERMCGGYITPTFPYLQTRIRREEALEFCMQPSHICARIYRRELFSKIRFSDMWYEDMACFPALVCAAERIGYYKVPLYYYRQHGSAITHNPTDARNLDVIKAWDAALRLKVPCESEKAALQRAVAKSFSEFIFFKPLYAEEYIRWYGNHLEGKSAIGGAEKETADITFPDDYPLRQQACVYGSQSMVSWLERLSALYENGGEYNMKEPEAGEALEEALLLQKHDGIALCGIRVRAKSPVQRQIHRELRKQNLIAKDRTIKEALLERIVVQAFAEHGYPIRIIGQTGRTDGQAEIL